MFEDSDSDCHKNIGKNCCCPTEVGSHSFVFGSTRQINACKNNLISQDIFQLHRSNRLSNKTVTYEAMT